MQTLTHLNQLEDEAIYIIREVAAECENPVMLYSIGKDSSVILHESFLSEKNLHSFSCILIQHGNLEFRDRKAKELGNEMIVHTNQEGVNKVSIHLIIEKAIQISKYLS
jgi:sulfate adenylyltransferase subunit 2